MMDFRTDKSSWVLVVLMMIISYFLNPFELPDQWGVSNLALMIVQVIAYPILSIAVACIPVVVVCFIIKLIPDIDYSIRVAFIFMLATLIYQLAT